ncbi:unnamed protein product (macronuclear) [Paramecium tetraurelia]|uniref:Protein kinase domain-containing protein n=1 Tax=Paramecium tetraurelia TaxID=5888 RepID=A0CD96_PARTE|nr:uncharacterized protein GSPATT00006974001 [Paramecium tetraurelia]CAK68763.1 unnamed protein product [Paramecium tetraurelia]|eukprot:XP_001436160.1 hypothetical protein (macronuclear) [Paramecium tetraurelia strain d4-2]
MGNNMTVNWSEQLKHSFDLYETNSQHNVLGNIDIYQYIPDKKVKIFSKVAYVPDKEYFLQKTKFKHPNLLRALALEKCSGSCSGDKDLYKVYYDYPGIQTLEEIINKKQSTKKITEQTIWKIIFQVVDCAEYLQSHFKTIGNINPKSIYSLKDGIKIFEVNHIFNIESSYEQALKNQIAILSPEQIDQLRRDILIPSVNGFKSDVYAFGIVLLCLTTMSNYTKFYTPNQELDKNQIFQNIQQIKMQYSELLCGLIQKMLLENPSERQSWIDIKRFIDPFKILEEKDQPFYSDLKLCPQVINKINNPTVESVQLNTQTSQKQVPIVVVSPNTTPRITQSFQQLTVVPAPTINQIYAPSNTTYPNQPIQQSLEFKNTSSRQATIISPPLNQPSQRGGASRNDAQQPPFPQNQKSFQKLPMPPQSVPSQSRPPQSMAPNSTQANTLYNPYSARPIQG